MTVQEFFQKLETVDFLYSMSDAPGAFDRGRKQVADIKEEAAELGGLYLRMFYDYQEYMSSIVTGGGIDKPVLEDYVNE